MLIVAIKSLNKFTVKRLAFIKSHSSNVEMTAVSVQAFRQDMKYLTRYAIIVIAILIIKQLKNKIVNVINNTKALGHDIKCLTRYAITAIAIINIIKLLKYKTDPVINNNKNKTKKIERSK